VLLDDAVVADGLLGALEQLGRSELRKVGHSILRQELAQVLDLHMQLPSSFSQLPRYK